MTQEEQILITARVAHEVNKAICEANGDDSQVEWDDAPENIKQSAIDGVRFHLKNPNVTPEDSHNNWLKFKKKDGWKYGKKKDAEKKTHPCMVSYDKLSFEDKVKDYAFRQVVHSLDAFIA